MAARPVADFRRSTPGTAQHPWKTDQITDGADRGRPDPSPADADSPEVLPRTLARARLVIGDGSEPGE